MKSVVVNDATPAYTLANTVIAATYTVTAANGTVTVTTKPAETAPANGAAGSYSFQVGTLSPGRSSTINFAVKVQQ